MNYKHINIKSSNKVLGKNKATGITSFCRFASYTPKSLVFEIQK